MSGCDQAPSGRCRGPGRRADAVVVRVPQRVVLFGGDLGDRVRVEDSSTMALSAANAATRAWRARLFTAGVAAAGLVEQCGGVVGEQGVGCDEPEQRLDVLDGEVSVESPDPGRAGWLECLMAAVLQWWPGSSGMHRVVMSRRTGLRAGLRGRRGGDGQGGFGGQRGELADQELAGLLVEGVPGDDDRRDAPRATVTGVETQQIRRKPVLGGLINEYTHAA